MTKSGPLEFEFKITPENPQKVDGVVQVGESFDLTLNIKSVKSPTYSHRGIDFEFCTEFAPTGGRVVKSNEVALRLSEGSVINGSADFTLPRCKISEHCQTYIGQSFTVKHFLRVWVRKLLGSEFYEQELKSYNIVPPTTRYEPLCVRIAVADSVRVDVLINRRKFDINDVIIGASHFGKVDLRLKMVRVQLVAQELIEVNGVAKKNKNIVDYWELIDGHPVKNEIVPFRLFLAPIGVSPSCSNPTGGYSVTHFLHFTIVTIAGDKYFKALQIRIFKMSRPPFFFIGEDNENTFAENIEKAQESSEKDDLDEMV